MRAASKNQRDGWVLFRIESFRKASSGVAAMVSMHEDGPSAPNGIDAANPGPRVPSA